jgi:hypothetical protein
MAHPTGQCNALQQAVVTQPVTYGKIVEKPKKSGG